MDPSERAYVGGSGGRDARRSLVASGGLGKLRFVGGCAESVAYPVNRLDPGWIPGVVAELSPQPLDVFLQRLADLNVIVPDDSLNESLGQCHVSVLGQQIQELELLWS